jgi:glutamyl endopeptidase
MKKITLLIFLISNICISQNCNTEITDSRRVQITKMSEPFTYIVQMTMKRGKSYNGTSFFIHPRVLLTAGHNLRKRPQFFFTGVKSLILRFGATNSNTNLFEVNLKTVQNDNIYTLQSFNNSYSVQEDYGIIILPDDKSYKAVGGNGTFKLSFINNNLIPKEIINISGYPGDKDFCTQWQDSTSNYYIKNEMLQYDFKTEHGLSGGPIWIKNNSNQYEVIGIHTNGQEKGCTTATIITKEIYDNIIKFCLTKGIDVNN